MSAPSSRPLHEGLCIELPLCCWFNYKLSGEACASTAVGQQVKGGLTPSLAEIKKNAREGGEDTQMSKGVCLDTPCKKMANVTMQ